MASIQAKKGKAGKKTYYVVVSTKGTHRWIKAGIQKHSVFYFDVRIRFIY